jgi:hypothetical protein
MLRGLQGRRIALAVIGDSDAEEDAATVRAALEQAGAQVDSLIPGRGNDREWHGARYAGLVLVGGTPSAESKLPQLVREFSLSEKPIAATGSAIELVQQAGGEARVAGQADTDIANFAARVVAEFAHSLEDRDLDEISEESFPASDPPANTPVSRPSPGSDSRA